MAKPQTKELLEFDTHAIKQRELEVSLETDGRLQERQD